MKGVSNLQILLVTGMISLVLITIGVLSKDVGVLGNAIILSTFLIMFPQVFLRYEKFREIKEMEERFPSFLRDLTESIKSGMPLSKAIQSVRKVEYGKLSKEIRKIANQISWGIPVDKVLSRFSERVKRSKQLPVAISIIRETHNSGGDVASTLDSVAEGLIMLQEAEKERKSMMNQYVAIMYAISLIFVGIVIGINRFLTPIFQVSMTPQTPIGMFNPCGGCYFSKLDLLGLFSLDPCSICGVYSLISSSLFFISPESPSSYYISLFFITALTQGFFAGLIIGVISENSVIAGIKHSLIIMGIVFGSFSILIRLGIMGTI